MIFAPGPVRKLSQPQVYTAATILRGSIQKGEGVRLSKVVVEAPKVTTPEKPTLVMA